MTDGVACICPYTDPSTWTTHYGAVEPGSTQEWDPACPVHPPSNPEPHPCGHDARTPGCGGCDPGAVEFYRDDTDPPGSWRTVQTPGDGVFLDPDDGDSDEP